MASERCPQCDGSGRISAGPPVTQDDYTRAISGIRRYQLCPTCGGRGELGGKMPWGCWTLILVPVFCLCMTINITWSLCSTGLLETVDPAQQAVAGTWALEEQVLVTPADEFARMELAEPASQDYTVRFQVTREEGDGPLVLGLPLEDRQFALVIDDSQHLTGFLRLDGQPLSEQAEPYREPVFEEGSNTILAVEVAGYAAGEEVTVTLRSGASKLLTWTGSRDSLALPEDWAVPGTRSLFVGSHGSVFRITESSYVSTSSLHWTLGLVFCVLLAIGLFLFKNR